MRLKPKRASIRNWRYQANGSSRTMNTSAMAATSASACHSVPMAAKCGASTSSIACMPPSSVSDTSTTAPNVVSTMPKRIRAIV